MKYRMLLAATAIAMLISPLITHAQGIPDGVAHGSSVGSNVAGPVGAVVGGAVGGVVGGVEGALGMGPYSAAYPVEAAPPEYYRGHRVRHSSLHLYRHVHPHYSHG